MRGPGWEAQEETGTEWGSEDGAGCGPLQASRQEPRRQEEERSWFLVGSLWLLHCPSLLRCPLAQMPALPPSSLLPACAPGMPSTYPPPPGPYGSPSFLIGTHPCSPLASQGLGASLLAQ